MADSIDTTNSNLAELNNNLASDNTGAQCRPVFLALTGISFVGGAASIDLLPHIPLLAGKTLAATAFATTSGSTAYVITGATCLGTTINLCCAKTADGSAATVEFGTHIRILVFIYV